MSLEDRIRVMVVDDHPIMRSGLRDTLEASGRFEVVGQAGDGEEAVNTFEQIDPQVIVMDVIMPCKDGIDACREIMERRPGMRVLMLTASNEEDAVIVAVAAGATGYLQKYSRPEELVEAVRDVAEGRLRIPDAVGEKSLHDDPQRGQARFQSDFQQTDGAGTGDPDDVRQRHVLLPNRQGEGQQHHNRPQHPLPRTGQAGHRDQAGTRHMGREERLVGRRGCGC